MGAAARQGRTDREVCVDWAAPKHSPVISLAEFTLVTVGRGSRLTCAALSCAALTRMQAAELSAPRELDQRRARLIRNLRGVCSLEPRAIAELVINLAARVCVLSLLEELAPRYAEEPDPCILRPLGGGDFPVGPLRRGLR